MHVIDSHRIFVSLSYVKSVHLCQRLCFLSHDMISKTKVVCCCRTMLLHDILCHWFCIRAFFCTVIIPRNSFCRGFKFQNKGSLLVLFCFPNLKWCLSHFFALIMTFPLCFPKQTAGWTRIALVCSTGFEQQLSKMWIEKGNTNRAFDLQSYNFKDSILLLRILGVDKTVCSTRVIHKFLKPEETIRANWFAARKRS